MLSVVGIFYNMEIGGVMAKSLMRYLILMGILGLILMYIL